MPISIFLLSLIANGLIMSQVVPKYGSEIGLIVGAAVLLLSMIMGILMVIADTLKEIRDKK